MAEININSSRDSYIRQGEATTNYGSEGYMGCIGGGDSQRPLIGFDLSGIPDGVIIKKVTLTINVYNYNGFCTISVKRLKRSDWVEGQVTWNVYKTGSSWQTAGADGSDDISSDVSGTFSPTSADDYDIDIDVDEFKTALLNDFISFRLSNSNTNYIAIYPRENEAPVLSVEYAMPSGGAIWFM